MPLAPGRRSRGLSTAHIFPKYDTIGEKFSRKSRKGGWLGDAEHLMRVNKKEACLHLWVGGSLLGVRRMQTQGTNNGGGGKRGKITGFSHASRRRLLHRLGRMDKKQLPLFLTLTYPDEYAPNHKNPLRVKRDLKVFKQRFMREFPAGCGIWRLEMIHRKSGKYVGEVFPHFHVLVWGVDYVQLLSWVGEAWYKVVGTGVEKHLRAGTRLERLRSWRGVMSYASKYLAKPSDEKDNSGDDDGDPPDRIAWGRIWGNIAQQNFPYVPCISIRLTDRQAISVIRYFRKLTGIKAFSFQRLTILGDPDFWFERLTDILEPL
jgi:hypothetical protein